MMSEHEYNYSEELLSDLHKDARGYRPREEFWQTWNDAWPHERQVIWDGLLAELDRSIEEAHYAQGRNLEKFRAILRNVMDTQGVDWKTAMRWLMQADGEEEWLEHWLWKQGLSWHKIKEVEALYLQDEAA